MRVILIILSIKIFSGEFLAHSRHQEPNGVLSLCDTYEGGRPSVRHCNRIVWCAMKLPEAVKQKNPSEASQEAKGHLLLSDQPSREARTNKRGEQGFGCGGEEEL